MFENILVYCGNAANGIMWREICSYCLDHIYIMCMCVYIYPKICRDTDTTEWQKRNGKLVRGGFDGGFGSAVEDFGGVTIKCVFVLGGWLVFLLMTRVVGRHQLSFQ